MASKSTTKAAAKQQQVAALPKEKNLNAKLGRLNSLNRNINAYINSKSPHFADVQAFVMASAEAEFAEGALAAEQEELQALQDELIALEGIAQPTQAQLDRIAALPGLITTQQDVVTDAVDDAADAQEALALAGTLEEALAEMSNKPIDPDVVTWAEGVLGVGENVGKIDEMREMLEAAVAEEAAAETPETVDPVVPVEPVPALKEKNLNAKLGRLNSLNRNINAYINSKSPHFADVQAFVMASAEAEFAEGALAAEQEELQALQDELIALEGIAQPTQAQLDRIAALPGLISTQQDVVTDAVDDAADAQEALALAGTLEEALAEMSNKPIDADVVTWAEGVLGVGENVGKIDEMREMLEAAVADEAAAETPGTVDPVVPVEPVPALKEKNLNAKLGRLNSLNRNINAYINSKSPHFADVQAFVMASAEAEFAEGALAAEQEELQALQDELIALEGIAQPTQAQLDRIAALPGLISTQQDVVTDAVDDAADAQEALALAGTLEDALAEMSNKPIDADVVTWAEGVLGVGENVGKIDEMREMLEAAVADEAAAETPGTVDPVVPVEPVPALKEKNLNAKLGRLNSLNRNINAYINSKSPHFADVQAFVMASAEAEFAEGASLPSRKSCRRSKTNSSR